MEIIKVIQDAVTKEFYWRGRIDSGFTSVLGEATKFKEGEDITEEFDLMACWYSNVFADRFLEIKTYIIGSDFSYD